MFDGCDPTDGASHSARFVLARPSWVECDEMCDAGAMADLELITDAAAGLERCGDLFRADPIGCNLVAAGLNPGFEFELRRFADGADEVHQWRIAQRAIEAWTKTGSVTSAAGDLPL